MSTKRKAYNLLLPIVVYAAAGLTVLLLLAGIIGYVLVKGPAQREHFAAHQRPQCHPQRERHSALHSEHPVCGNPERCHRASLGGRGRLSERVRQKPQKLIALIEYTTETLAGHSQHHLRPGGYAGVQPEAEPGRLPDLRQPDAGYHGAAHHHPHHPGKPEDRAPELPRRRPLAWAPPSRHIVRTLVLPCSLDGIVSGCILAVGRIVGESAALLFTAGTGKVLASSIAKAYTSSGATLSVALYMTVSEDGDFAVGYAIAAVLMVLVLCLNGLAKPARKKLKT